MRLSRDGSDDSVRRAMEDKEIADAGANCLGVVLLIVAVFIFVTVWTWAGFWAGLLVAALAFFGGMLWIAAKRYPR